VDFIAVHTVHANHGVEMQATHCYTQDAGGKSDLCHFGCTWFLFRTVSRAIGFLKGVELIMNFVYMGDHFAAAVDEAATEKQAPENEE